MYFSIASIFQIIGFALFLAYMAVIIYSNALLSGPEKNRFRNSFPYNFYISQSMRLRIVSYALLALSSLSTIVGESFFLISFSGSYMYLLAVMLPLSLLCLSVSNFLSLTFYKAHITLAFLGFVLFAVCSILFGISYLVPSSMLYTEQVVQPIFVIVLVIGIVMLLSLLNPKLLYWFRMDKTEEDGKTYYVKPKINFFAMYEWIFTVMEYLVSFLFLLNVVIKSVE